MNDCTIYFDGGVRGNIGVTHSLYPASRGAWGWVAIGHGHAKIMEGSGLVSPATSMVAELQGCLHALTWAAGAGYEHVTLKGDSKFVTEWLRGKNRTSQAPHLARIQYQIARLVSHDVIPASDGKRRILLTKAPGKLHVTPMHVPRSKNRYADALCTKALTAPSL